jgi:hypothetical protein
VRGLSQEVFSVREKLENLAGRRLVICYTGHLALPRSPMAIVQCGIIKQTD